MAGEVHGIAARRAARRRITVAGCLDLSIKTLGQARIESPLAALLDARQTTEHLCRRATYRHDVMDLTPQSVHDINGDGGTVLGTSRGPQDPHQVVDCLERLGARRDV